MDLHIVSHFIHFIYLFIFLDTHISIANVDML